MYKALLKLCHRLPRRYQASISRAIWDYQLVWQGPLGVVRRHRLWWRRNTKEDVEAKT
jgi:hypothetical protein